MIKKCFLPLKYDPLKSIGVVVVKQTSETTSETNEVVKQNSDTHRPEDEPGLNVETPPG